MAEQGAQVTSPGFTYRLLSTVLFPFWLLHAWQHGRRHAEHDYLGLRLFPGRSGATGGRIWVHASSVGEVRAIAPLVRRLLERGESILFTSFTATGLQTIRRDFGDTLASAVIPIDFGPVCRQFLLYHRPRLGLVMETELWPALLHQAARRRIPLLQVNARLSSKTLDTGPFTRDLLTRVLGYFDRFLARSERDRERLLRLGARAEDVCVLGNIKSLRDESPPPARLVERDYLLLASSHAGEERKFLRWRENRASDALIVIAPRHPQRGDEIERDIAAARLSCARRSHDEPVTEQTDVYLADTLGELRALMAHARVVVMGGSFDDTGGHNLIEPANLGCAIVTGPSDAGIRDDIKMLGEGVIQVGDMHQCWKTVDDLWRDPARATRLGQRARERLAQQPDPVQAYLDALEPWLTPPASRSSQ
ncbi:MAG: glycosyltransferase N-terminal domain-containing protein [Gammaproteobacteria bacterium]|nr:glycosyltransferase N-terminal domain-containing protein [Gammaproteobacteria bacterium]